METAASFEARFAPWSHPAERRVISVEAGCRTNVCNLACTEHTDVLPCNCSNFRVRFAHFRLKARPFLLKSSPVLEAPGRSLRLSRSQLGIVVFVPVDGHFRCMADIESKTAIPCFCSLTAHA